MAITVAMRTEITQLYVALFGRAPDSEGLGYWVGLRNAGQSTTQIANTMFATEPARAIYPSWMTNGEIIASFYVNVLGRTADAEGLAFWTAKLNAAGATTGSVITQMINNVANYTGTDANGLLSQKLFNNSVTVAQYYAEHGGNVANSFAVLDGVTDQAGSVTTAIAAINNGTIGGSGGPQTLTLTVSQDGLSSGAANDMFVANVVQNQLGLQVNTLGSGDTLNGGAGTDTLMAKVTAGAFAGADWVSMPIQPMTSGIEVVKLEAVNFDIDSGNNWIDSTTVYVNAKDMLGVNTIGSWHSDANLVIQNMTTQDNNGIGRELKAMTVLMGYTGNSDSHWNESDLSVYFDQDYLNPSTSFTKPSVDIRLMNEDKYDVDYVAGLRGLAIEALAGVYVEKLVITLGGGGQAVRSYSLAQYIGELGTPNSDPKTDFIKTYPQLLAAVQAAVVLLKAANPNDATLQTLQAVDGGTFLSDISPVTGLRREGESVTLTVDGSTNGVANTLVVQAQDLVLDPIATTPIPNSNRFERAEATPAVPSTQLSINVELEKVGLAGDGGQLLVGSMFKDGENEWSDLYKGKGISVFDVTVSGGSDKPSSLSGMHSTGNNLRQVNVTTNAAQTKDYAALTIGNSNTSDFGFLQDRVARIGDVILPKERNANALKDVQTFNAAGLKGDLTLFAALTDEVTAKYMNLVDAAPAAASADNVQFVYTGGSGNDYINLWLDDENLARAGTTTREDFNLTINGGAGNDEIVTRIGDGSAGSPFKGGEKSVFANLVDSGWDNWYQNSAINANLNINGDAGNDTIRTLGSGNWIINGGSGDDTIYADNTGFSFGEDSQTPDFNGGKATWVFNSVNTDVDNLLSQNAATVSAVNANLTVNFMGYAKTVNIANSKDSLINVAITDLAINQAIKLAINADPVLNKLLVAEDGPGRTLIVRSLIDGRMDDGMADYNTAAPIDNLKVTFSSTALSVAQLTNPALVLFPTASGTLLDGYSISTTDGDARFGTDGSVTLRGGDSFNVADNKIEGGTGTDVIVLGTGKYSNDTLVYKGLLNGTDSIVNFQDKIIPPGAPVWNSTSYEQVTLAFSDSDGSPVAETIIFDGVTVNLAAPTLMGIIPSLDVASQFVNQYNAAAATNGWVAVLGAATTIPSTAEVATMTGAGGLTAGQTYTVAGLTYTSTAVTTQAQLLAAFASLADGATTGAGTGTGTYSGALAGYSTSAVAANVVSFTSSTAGNVADLTDSGTGAAAATIAVTAQGTSVPGYSVTLTHDIPGAVADLTAASFTGTYFGAANGNGVVAVAVTTPGVDNPVLGSASTFTVTYTTATTAVTAAGDAAITNPVSLVTGDGALTAANKLAASLITGYTAGSVVAAADGSSYSVTFTATVNGATAIPADTTFGLGATPTDGVNGSLTSTLGVANTTTPPTFTISAGGPASDFDFIDFTSYVVTGVVVNDTNQINDILGSTFKGIVGTANGAVAKWITMTESTTNDGEYTINLVTSTASGVADDTTQLIGVADFGYEKDFSSFTFIL